MRNRREYQREWQKKRLASKHAQNPNAIMCEICGNKYIQVCGHVYQSHGMTAREYKEKFGWDVKRGLIPEELREVRAKHTRENGTIENLKAGKKFWFKKGSVGPGRYKRSKQIMARLRRQIFRGEFKAIEHPNTGSGEVVLTEDNLETVERTKKQRKRTSGPVIINKDK